MTCARPLTTHCSMIRHLLPASFAVVLSLASAVCFADGIALFPVTYERTDGGEVAPELVDKVAKKAAEGVREAGFEIVPRAKVDASIEKVSAKAPCVDRECLAAVADDLGAADALLVSVVDEDRTTFRVTVALARREGVSEEKTAGFFVILEWLRGTVALTLQKAVTPSVETVEQPDSTEGEGETEEPKQVEEEATPEESAEGPGEVVAPLDDGKLGPVPFYVSAAVTGALLISWGVTDAVVHSRYEELRDDDMEREDWLEKRDSARSLQTADRVLLGIAAAGVLATGVLFFLTDFDREVEQENPGIRAVGPTAFKGGGGLSIAGEF